MIVAIITGHSRGLGSALTDELLARGVAVLGLSRHLREPQGHASLAVTTERAAEATTLQQVALDLSDSAALAAWLATDALAHFTAQASQVLLFNNAGLVQPMGAPGRQSASAIATTVALNVAAPLMLADALVATTAGRTERHTELRIVHISSGAARTPYAGWSVYCATKAALDMHARTVQLDGVPGLRVASVAPGVIDTDMQACIRATPAGDFPMKGRFEALHHDGQLARASDVARRLVAHVLSDAFGTDPTPDLRQL
jgi:NAD(P)-dependent dehydrogenase (short-subunit alcohol dehydrogenase family)